MLISAKPESKDGENNSIVSVCGELEKAIDNRKFSDAKELISVLMPLMKKDIKESKKLLAIISKSDQSDEIENFTNKYNRKSELYKSTKGLVESSPAAIRVKGKDLMTMLNEYIQLVDKPNEE